MTDAPLRSEPTAAPVFHQPKALKTDVKIARFKDESEMTTP